MDTELFSAVVKIISPYAKNLEMLEKVALDTNIHRDLRVNSTRFVDIVLEFEDKFGLSITDEDADKMETVGDCVKLVKRLKH